jgi:hypothetical protein
MLQTKRHEANLIGRMPAELEAELRGHRRPRSPTNRRRRFGTHSGVLMMDNNPCRVVAPSPPLRTTVGLKVVFRGACVAMTLQVRLVLVMALSQLPGLAQNEELP